MPTILNPSIPSKDYRSRASKVSLRARSRARSRAWSRARSRAKEKRVNLKRASYSHIHNQEQEQEQEPPLNNLLVQKIEVTTYKPQAVTRQPS
ncbi:hypothetical protein BPAE_0005g00490 [Botrytis paeoniae]|uniref:Uncharacterized protein n=1 Tax=Botrytis paeoniae TaxID=278948 RepID=A0A4Z1G895_9HELO|nr:hypothetical protein BPAE_0005g00490 [Botrytis paeoniae]